MEKARTKATAKPTILVVHATTGSGHKTAAESVAAALDDICKYDLKIEVDIKTLDLLDYGIIKFDGNKAANTYTGKIAPIHDVSWRYNFTGRLNWGGSSLISETLFRKFKSYIKKTQPDVVICTHMMAANAAAGARKKLKLNFPIVSVPTDYETEGLWPHKLTDLFCVATDSMAETLEARRVPKEKILVTGLPVAPGFTKEHNKQECRDKFNLPKDKQIALLLAGASEATPYRNLQAALNHVITYFAMMDWMHFVFCTGKDAAYKEYLEQEKEKHNANNITILGYTNDMASLMASADIALCKSGGLTITECICAQLPLVIIGRGYAQEHVNQRYLTSVGAAFHATTYKEIVDTLCNITSNDAVREGLLENLKNIRREAAAYDISRAALQLAGFDIDGKVKVCNDKCGKSFLGVYIGKKPAHTR